MQVEENSEPVELLNVRNISSEKAVNLALVFDHSGSMVNNPKQMPKDIETMEYHYRTGTLPAGYVMAIEHAQKGVNAFLSEGFDVTDSLMLVSFSSSVANVTTLSNDVEEVSSIVSGLMPGGMTAYYDALISAIKGLSSESNSSKVIVALTDGQDNRSILSHEDVIDAARAFDVKIYNIGLGGVNEEILKDISEQTGGLYYHTDDPEKLKGIYLSIRDQIRSIYQLDYHSELNEIIEEEQILRFSFTNDTLSFSNPEERIKLPEEVQQYLAQKEAERLELIQERAIQGGTALLIVAALSLFAFSVRKRKKKSKLSLLKVYPNPFNNSLSLEYDVADALKAKAVILDSNGVRVKEKFIPAFSTETKFDTTELNAGLYFVHLESEQSKSEVQKVLKS